MRNAIDFSSWQGLVSTLLGLILVSVMAVGVRLLLMQRIQQRRERENRQINERLKTLIAAYKTLGGSFTGNLAVHPGHLRDSGMRAAGDGQDESGGEPIPGGEPTERQRRMRDAVEAALADIMLLGTSEQVALAVEAANDMVAGRQVEVAELVVSLRRFIRKVLELGDIPDDLSVPKQGPVRVQGAGGGGGGSKGGGRSSGGGGGGGGGSMAMGGAMGAGRRSAEIDALPGP